MSGSKITGVTFEEMMEFKRVQGQHHPDRKKGKTAELALGYGGWINALKAFGADKFMNEEEMRALCLAWRAASPSIVEFWGGQYRHTGKPWDFTHYDYYGCEGAAIMAILNPGQCYSAGQYISFGVKDDVLYMRLPSGRLIPHHRPRLTAAEKFGVEIYNISYEGVNGNPKRGPQGKWMRIDTYGGSLVESAVQGASRDWHAYAMLNLEQRGYTPAFHVHDEPIAEVPRGFGSVQEMESIMMEPQGWAPGCPIKASGGWRGHRYRKD
jgi:DNA polymerase